MIVKVIHLYQDKYTQEIHKPNEEIEVTSAKRLKELVDAGVVEKVEIPAPPVEEPEEKKPVKKATTKTTTKRVKKND